MSFPMSFFLRERGVILAGSRTFRCLSSASSQQQNKKSDVSLHIPGPSWMKESGRKRVVVLGSGWAAYRIMRDLDIDKYDLTVVSPRNHFLFTPLLPSTTVGTLEFRGIIEPIRTARKRLNYVQFSCTNIDPENQTIIAESFYTKHSSSSSPSGDNDNIPERFDETSSPECPREREKIRLRYDKLVIAVGAKTATFGIPGVSEFCFYLKQLSDARLIRNRILECFERAASPRTTEEERNRLLSFVIVGGGPTSIEFAASLHDFCAFDVRKWYPELHPHVRITVVEAGPKVLSSFDESLSEYLEKNYKKRNITVRTNVSVQCVQRHSMDLSDGTVLPFGCGVWSAGNTSVQVIDELDFPKDRGRLIVDEYLRIPGVDNVFAAGDCCCYPSNPLPPTAQAAEQQGKSIAKNLNRMAKGKPLSPFAFHYRGMFVYTGVFSALLDSPFGKTRGFVSWLLYVGTYLTKLVSVRNKIMIPMYWFKSFVFGRDIGRF